MKIVNKLFSQKEFRDYLKDKNITRTIDKIVLHHTHSTVDEWKKGERSTGYYKKLYEDKGWTSGPHFFIASRGIWLFTDINIQGTHANKGNLNSIGIEIVGRYNTKLPEGEIWNNTKFVLKLLLKKLNLSIEDIHFHREYSEGKVCPGRALTKRWIKNEMS